MPRHTTALQLAVLVLLFASGVTESHAETTSQPSPDHATPPRYGHPPKSLCRILPIGTSISRTSNALKGPIQYLTQEYSKFTTNEVETPRELSTVEFYDRHGTRITSIGICSRLKNLFDWLPDYCKHSTAYDKFGRITSIHTLENHSDEQSNQPTIQSKTFSFTYDTNGNLDQWTVQYYDGSISTSRVRYSADHRVLEVKKHGTETTLFRYNKTGNVLFIETIDTMNTIENGTRSVAMYDKFENALYQLIDNPLFEYISHCSSVYGEDGNLISYEHNALHSQSESLTPQRFRITYAFEDQQNQIIMNIFEATNPTEQIGAIRYDRYAHVTSEIHKFSDQVTIALYSHELDAYKNWIKEIISNVKSEPITATYRNIYYYNSRH